MHPLLRKILDSPLGLMNGGGLYVEFYRILLIFRDLYEIIWYVSDKIKTGSMLRN